MNRRFSLSALVAALLAGAQSLSRAGLRVGTIQAIERGDSLITISGQNYGYSDEIIKVFLDGDPVGQGILEPGAVEGFSLDRNGVQENVDLLGPADKTDAYSEHWGLAFLSWSARFNQHRMAR